MSLGKDALPQGDAKEDNMMLLPADQTQTQITDNPKWWGDAEQQELSFVAVGNEKWCCPFGRQFLKKLTYSYRTDQQSLSLLFT